MQNTRRLSIAFILLVLMPQFLFANEEETADKYKDYKAAEVESSSDNIYNLEENFTYHFYAGVQEGC